MLISIIGDILIPLKPPVDIYLRVKSAHQYTQSNGCQCYELLYVNCILIMAGTNSKEIHAVSPPHYQKHIFP